jgi:AraC-like DNA-binding protein
MCAHTSGSTPWSGALAVDDGALCYLGSLAYARGHHHVATQLVRAWSGSFELTDVQGRRHVGSAAVIPSGCHHSIRILEPCSGFLLFVDPGTAVGRQLSAMADVTDDVRTWFAAGEVIQNWTETELPDPAKLLAKLKETLAATPELAHANWHPSLLAAVELISQRLPERVTLGEVATGIALSPSRLSRLFRDQLGQSFPTYVRWARVRLAIDALRAGASLTDAAHAAGFTDSAHANRVCHEMFGLSPSQASGQLVWS